MNTKEWALYQAAQHSAKLITINQLRDWCAAYQNDKPEDLKLDGYQMSEYFDSIRKFQMLSWDSKVRNPVRVWFEAIPRYVPIKPPKIFSFHDYTKEQNHHLIKLWNTFNPVTGKTFDEWAVWK